MYTFEHGDSLGLDNTDFYISRTDFHATIYVFCGDLKIASQLYRRALRTALKGCNLPRREIVESSLRPNVEILQHIYSRTSRFKDMGQWRWQLDTSDIIAATTDSVEEELLPCMRSLCTNITTLYPGLPRCESRDYYHESLDELGQYRAGQHFSKSSQNLPSSTDHLIPGWPMPLIALTSSNLAHMLSSKLDFLQPAHRRNVEYFQNTLVPGLGSATKSPQGISYGTYGSRRHPMGDIDSERAALVLFEFTTACLLVGKLAEATALLQGCLDRMKDPPQQGLRGPSRQNFRSSWLRQH